MTYPMKDAIEALPETDRHSVALGIVEEREREEERTRPVVVWDGLPVGRWSKLEEIRAKGRRCLKWWPHGTRLSYFVDTSYLLGVVKAQHHEIERLRSSVCPARERGEG